LSKRTISQIMLALLLTGMLTVIFRIQPVRTEPSTITVPDDYSTIQEAVNNANVGDTVFVRNGTYYENVVINKSLTLVGESKDAIIWQNYTYVTLEISEDNVTVEGFTIFNYFEVYESPPMPCCMFLNSSSDCQIRDNEFGFDYPSYGLAIKGGSGNRIEKNTAQNGIFVYGGSENRIEENVVDDVGIYVYGSTLNVIIKNTVYSQYYPLELTNSNYNYILYNCLYPISYMQVCVSMRNSNNNTIEGNTMVGGGAEMISRMELWASCNNSIFHNNFDGDRGVEMLVNEDSERNVWNDGYPSGGNYWTDYNGTDLDKDGIGDTPYVIDESNQDNYPLMNPWSPTVQNLNTGLYYTAIQGAISALETLDGHKIFVSSGTYVENVRINKSISLVGENKYNTIIDGNSSGTVLRITADNVNVTNFTISNGTAMGIAGGVALTDCAGCHINNNIFRDNLHGMVLENCSNSVIADNVILCPPWHGTPLATDGILMYNPSKNVIANNTISSGYVALGLVGGLQNTVQGNRFYSNWYGIRIHDSTNNTIFANEVFNNKRGIHIGCYAPELGILNNLVYHNDFINNTQQATKTNSINIWDNGYSLGGNYWSDYNGTDLYSGPYQNESGSDGIGDTPYIIPDGYPVPEGQDSYPLMKPLFWWNLADVNYDLKVDLYDAVRLLAAYGCELGDEEYNPRFDIAEPYGIINLYDAVELLTNYGKKHP
jgi:nitrous oxidase accessory protein